MVKACFKCPHAISIPTLPRSEEVLALVQAEAVLTVRIRVKHTSSDRPDGYPFSKFRGQDVAHTGTGVIRAVCAEGNDHFFDSASDDTDDEGKCCSDEEDDDRDEETRRRDFEAYEQENRKPAFTKDDCPCYDCEDVRYLARHQKLKEEKNVGTLAGCEGAGPRETNIEDPQTPGELPNQTIVTGEHQVSKQSLECEESDLDTTEEPSERPCWLILVETALHVVYDTKEARSTVVDVFHDTNTSSPRSQTLYGFRVVNRYDEEDKCIFECATHNEELVRKLSESEQKRHRINRSLGRPIWTQSNRSPAGTSESFGDSDTNSTSTDQQMTSLSPQEYRMAIIIGHPHGRSKTISVGQWTHRVKHSETKTSVLTHYLYDAPTCKGNSGGAVMTFGKMEEERVTTVLLNHHHRSSSAIPGLNMSSPSYEYTHEFFGFGST